MIYGEVDADRKAMVTFAVRGTGDKQSTVRALIDTGFDGYLSLTPAVH